MSEALKTFLLHRPLITNDGVRHEHTFLPNLSNCTTEICVFMFVQALLDSLKWPGTSLKNIPSDASKHQSGLSDI